MISATVPRACRWRRVISVNLVAEVNEVVLVDRPVLRFGDHHPAAADAEVERFVEISVLLLEHVAAGDPQVRGAVLDVGRDVGVPHDEDPQVVRRNGNDEPPPGPRLVDGAEVDPGAREQRQRLVQDPPPRQRDGEGGVCLGWLGGLLHADPLARRTSAPSARSFLSRRS
jgi:hypothetical protein